MKKSMLHICFGVVAFSFVVLGVCASKKAFAADSTFINGLDRSRAADTYEFDVKELDGYKLAIKDFDYNLDTTPNQCSIQPKDDFGALENNNPFYNHQYNSSIPIRDFSWIFSYDT